MDVVAEGLLSLWDGGPPIMPPSMNTTDEAVGEAWNRSAICLALLGEMALRSR